MSKKKSLSPKLDVVFQALFGEVGSEKIILTDKFEFHIIIMSKIEEANLEDKELLDWLYFLDNPESEKVKNIMKTNKELKEAGEKLNKISQDEKLRKIAELRQKAIMDEKAIFRKGSEERF